MPYILWPLLSLGVFLPLTKLLQKQRPCLSAVCKMLATLCAAALALSGGLKESGWLCVTALLLCAAADGLLCVHFVTGMAVFAAGHVAYMVWFLTGQGIAVPGDINLAGFDDTPLCTLLSPTLTTVRQDIPLRAKIAVEKLRLLKQGRETEALVRLPVRLIARESTR